MRDNSSECCYHGDPGSHVDRVHVVAVYKRVEGLLLWVVRRSQRVALRRVAGAGGARARHGHAPALGRGVRRRLRAVAAAVRRRLDPATITIIISVERRPLQDVGLPQKEGGFP